MTKGISKAITNVKPMAGGVTLYQMMAGDYAYGDKGATDLMNFTHFYRKNGDVVQLGAPHKAYLGGLILTEEVEGNVPPVEPPPPTPAKKKAVWIVDGVTRYFTED